MKGAENTLRGGNKIGICPVGQCLSRIAPGWLRLGGRVHGGNIGEASTNGGGLGWVDLDGSTEMVTIGC